MVLKYIVYSVDAGYNLPPHQRRWEYQFQAGQAII